MDGSQSDDLMSGSAEMLEEPEEVEKPIEMRISGKGKKPVAPKKSVEPEKFAEPGVGDSVEDLLGGLSDTSGGLMDISKDCASESGSGSDGRGSEGVFETENFIPVSPIYQHATAGLVGSGVGTGFNNSAESGVGGEDAAKDGGDDVADTGGDAAVVGVGEAAFEAAVANAAEIVASGSVAAGSVADTAPIPGVKEDLTFPPPAIGPEGQMSVGLLLDRGDGGSVPGDVEGGAAVGQGGGLPGPGVQDLFQEVPQLLVAPNADLFNRLLVCFYSG